MGVSPERSATKADGAPGMLVPCQVVPGLASVILQAFAKQVCASISGLSKEAVPGCAIQLGKRFGRGAKQDEGSLSVRAAKTSASHIPIRLPPSARIECVSRVVLASLSIVCQNGLCALHWDLAASPSASRTLVTASPEFSLAKADAAASGLWQMHESCRAACLTMSRL